MLSITCNEDKQSWIEVQDKFDRDGVLHLAINEWLPDRVNPAFREQCVHLTRDEVADLITHLRKAHADVNFGHGE